jgi:hypothetical protein
MVEDVAISKIGNRGGGLDVYVLDKHDEGLKLGVQPDEPRRRIPQNCGRMPNTRHKSDQVGRLGALAEARRALVENGAAGGRQEHGGHSMTPAKPQRTERLQIILPALEVAAIDEFRFRARMPSRAAAVRELLRRGLTSAEKIREENPNNGEAAN